ncbi:acetyltransferase [Cyclobacterium sp. SYSU L10401]|uniref:acetyltransferase n=1 Tax=Cyclobacterium sp. SYSU L10401 TaxID=2678657 RepID=UPI0013D5BEEB|nr:acetyltransferase [Cyclobacterium sp. SYSU L10401]
MEKPIIIFGAKGIAHPALEIFNSHDLVVFGFLDEDESLHKKEINNIVILGGPEDDGFLKLIGKKCEAFVAVDDARYRESVVKMLNEKRKVQPVNALHRMAYISTDAAIGHGNFINAKVTIGAGADIGNHCILHTNATIEHQVSLGDFVQVGAGAVVNSGVTIENGAFLGSGVTVVAGIKIGKDARIGAGSVVIADVAANQTVFGNPAKVIEK